MLTLCGRVAPSLGALALVAASGFGIQALLPRPLESSWWSRAGFAYLLGIAWTGWFAWVAGMLLGAQLRSGLFALAVALPVLGGGAALAVRRSWGGLAAGGRRRPAGWPLVTVAVVLAGVTVVLLGSAAVDPVSDFDGRMTWGTQAELLRSSGSIRPPALLDADAYVIHPRYPILMPLAQVAVVELSGGRFDGWSVRPLYALFLVALAAAALPATIRAGGRRGAAIAFALLLLAHAVVWNREGGASGSYSDLPLAAMLGAGFCALLHPRARREAWRGLVAGLLLAGALGCKNEGLLLAPSAAGIVACFSARRPRSTAMRRGGAAALALVAVFAATALVLAWRHAIPNRNDEGYFERFSIMAIATGFFDRARWIFWAIRHRTFDWQEWGALFWVLPPLLLAGSRAFRGRSVRVATALIGVEGVLVIGAYAVAPQPQVAEVTWNRFILQAAVPLAVLVAAASRATLVAAVVAWRGRDPAAWRRESLLEDRDGSSLGTRSGS